MAVPGRNAGDGTLVQLVPRPSTATVEAAPVVGEFLVRRTWQVFRYTSRASD